MADVILIHTSSDDAHAESVARCLGELGADVHILVRERCFMEWSISSIEDEIIIKCGSDHTWTASDIRAVFWRRDYIVEPAWVQMDFRTQDVGRFIAEQRAIHVESAFKRLAITVPFINDINQNRLCNSKSLQHHFARKCGLLVPSTFIGSDSKYAERFASLLWENEHRCCTKNIESTHLELLGIKHARLTQLFCIENLSDLTGLEYCPMIFQEYIEKKYEYRVTIVGKEVYACLIDSQVAGGDTAVDWRNYDIPSTPHFAVKLESHLELKLVKLIHELGLTYGAIDLVESPNGDFYFLEVNSMGQWLWIEDLTELPISMSIARHLADPNLIRRFKW